MPLVRLVFVLFLGVAALLAQPSRTDDRWAPLSFLIGDWVGEGGGEPGQGSGGFSFLPDQNGTILVRKNRADYPGTKDKPAYSHTDLMMVYQEPGATKISALYFDSEDHVIHYDVVAPRGGNRVQFVSPNYRLTYSKTGPDTVAIRFEIAPPDKLGQFKTYIEAKARRAKR